MSLAIAPTDSSNAELVRWEVEALNRGDAGALRQVLTSETVERFPDRTCRGADEIVAYFEEALAAVPDWHMEVRAIVAERDDVLMHWHLTGTHTGPLLGIAATGKPFSIDGIDHFVLGEGKIVSNFVVFDQMQYARQVGLMPPNGSAGDKALKASFNARTKLAGRIKRRSA